MHAYCLMSNHLHLLLSARTPEGPGALMKMLGQRYVQYINRTYRRSGTLWEGRFRSCLLQDEGYLLECHRYIELNPVRAAMVEHPGMYRWSSYRANAQGESSPWLKPHPLYRSLRKNPAERQAAYREPGAIGVQVLLGSALHFLFLARDKNVCDAYGLL